MPSKSKTAGKKRQTRKYSKADKGAALAVHAAEGGNTKRTSRVTGVPERTVGNWAEGRGVDEEVKQEAEQAKEGMADRLEKLVHKCLDLLPGKLENASARDVAGVMHIAVDKRQLLMGQPTAINETLALTPEQKQRIAALRARVPAPAEAPQEVTTSVQ